MTGTLTRWCQIPYLTKRLATHITTLAVALVITSCATRFNHPPRVKHQPKLAKTHYTSYDGDRFGYKKWPAKKDTPKTIIIGIHGISGHAGDFENLSTHLSKHNPQTSLYAPETRGQGMDEKKHRRGDIRKASEWHKDLYTFTRLVRAAHPKARIVWFGESMGSLIALHAYGNPPHGAKRPDGLILCSPIVGVSNKIPAWKSTSLRIAAFALPKYKVSLENLSGVHNAQVTKDDIHSEQAAKNPWYIRRYTLRLLVTLGDMVESLPEQAAKVQCPTLILHGGKDIFTDPKNVQNFSKHFALPAKTKRHFYPKSYHLLMYDHKREVIFNDVSRWLRSLNK
ncbi:MAG: alpha/beta fold hydrolase [Akkermansiaceae bacterium]